jgi:dihydrofolate reductase
MRVMTEMKASVFVGMSLDGFIARPSGAFDFLSQGGEGEPHGFEEFLASIDALVMGRHTYEVVAPFETWPYGTKPVIVLTNRALAPTRSGVVVEAMSGEPADIVAQLEARGLRHLYVDGGLTVQRFLKAGLITNITMTRVPVLIGDGIPLFGAVPHDIPLQHVATKVLKGGGVQSEYVVSERP